MCLAFRVSESGHVCASKLVDQLQQILVVILKNFMLFVLNVSVFTYLNKYNRVVFVKSFRLICLNSSSECRGKQMNSGRPAI